MNLKIIAALLLTSLCAGCATTTHSTSAPQQSWSRNFPHATAGYVLVRLKAVSIRLTYSEASGQIINATFVPIEFKYPGGGDGFGGGGRGGGSGFLGRKALDVQPVETEIGKPFSVWMHAENSDTHSAQQSIVNLLKSCAAENNSRPLKLNAIFSIPIPETATDWPEKHWPEERDYCHWFIESLEIAKH